jgi:putative ABC transport system substrate-binding protein
MRRREFITFIGGTSALWSFAALAQQPKLFRIGVLMGLAERDPESERWVQAFFEGLSELGWKRDKNLRIDIRWASSDPARMQELAKELIDLGPDLILATTTPPTAAILQLTHTIPVVFSVVSDPLGSGFVESFARPGRNATGFVNFEDSLASKWLELLKLLAPKISEVSLPFNPKTAPQATYYLKLLDVAAPSFGLNLKPVRINTAGELEAEITSLAQQPSTGLVVLPDIFTGRKRIAR